MVSVSSGTMDDIVKSRAAAYDQHYRTLWRSHKWTKESIEARLAYVLDVEQGGNIAGKEIQHALRLVGTHDLAGKTVLDYCCGTGITAIYFALCGATVYAFDASQVAVDIARESAALSGVQDSVRFSVQDARKLTYRDGVFDVAFCRSALHIVVGYPECSLELRRVLRPGAKAVFCEEALGHNPAFECVRWFLRRRWHDTGDDRALKYSDICAFGQPFARTVVHHFHLFALGKRAFKKQLEHGPLRGWFCTFLRAMEATDRCVLESAPWLERFCGSVVVEYVKE